MSENYEGETYVAYLDISGFSEMMNEMESAQSVLDKFYLTIFNTRNEIGNVIPRISVIVASDCAVIFTRNSVYADRVNGLLKLLEFIKLLNERFILSDTSQPFTTTCSIAYGRFNYEALTETTDVQKNYLFGRPYRDAVMDQKVGTPRIKPGECRLVGRNMPYINRSQDGLFRLLIRKGRRKHFYWMLSDSSDHMRYNNSFVEAYRNRKRDNYAGVIRVIKKARARWIKLYPNQPPTHACGPTLARRARARTMTLLKSIDKTLETNYRVGY